MRKHIRRDGTTAKVEHAMDTLAPGAAEQLAGKTKATIGQGQARLGELTHHPEMVTAGHELEVEEGGGDRRPCQGGNSRCCRARQGNRRANRRKAERPAQALLKIAITGSADEREGMRQARSMHRSSCLRATSVYVYDPDGHYVEFSTSRTRATATGLATARVLASQHARR